MEDIIASMTKTNKVTTTLLAIAAGAINGIMGSGGGIIVVILLLTAFCLTQKQAQATALFVILPLSVVSAIVYIVKGSVPLWNTIYVTIGVIVGGVVGALLLSKIPNNISKLIFAIFLIAGGVKLLLGVIIA